LARFLPDESEGLVDLGERINYDPDAKSKGGRPKKADTVEAELVAELAE
jgi:hypothetical protein